MPVVPLQCPRCAGLLQIDSAWGGQQVACPLCQGPLVLPPEQTLLGMLGAVPPTGAYQPPPESVATLNCPVCSGPFQVQASLAGQQVGCPHCGSPVIVPPLSPPATPAPHEVPLSPPPQPNPEQMRATLEDLLPPGAAAVLPPTERPREQPRLPPVDERLPPAMKRPTERTPPPETRVDREAADRLPPSKKPAIDERLPPSAALASSPPSHPSPPPEPTPKKRRPEVSDLLPPGAAAAELPAASPQVPSPPAHVPAAESPVAAMLPPGAANEPAAPAAIPARRALAETLLPPGAEATDAAAAGAAQVPIPAAPQRTLQPVKTAPGTAIVPTADGGYVTVQESPKIIGSGDEEVEIRRLPPEEKARRRFRRGLILWTVCVLILLFVMWYFTQGS